MSTVVTECMTTAEIRSSFYTEVFCAGRLTQTWRTIFCYQLSEFLKAVLHGWGRLVVKFQLLLLNVIFYTVIQ